MEAENLRSSEKCWKLENHFQSKLRKLQVQVYIQIKVEHVKSHIQKYLLYIRANAQYLHGSYSVYVKLMYIIVIQ